MDSEPTNRNALAAVIAAHMATRTLTLRDVSDATAIPLTTLHRCLRFDPDQFKVNQLKALADLFGLTPAALLAEAEVAA